MTDPLKQGPARIPSNLWPAYGWWNIHVLVLDLMMALTFPPILLMIPLRTRYRNDPSFRPKYRICAYIIAFVMLAASICLAYITYHLDLHGRRAASAYVVLIAVNSLWAFAGCIYLYLGWRGEPEEDTGVLHHLEQRALLDESRVEAVKREE